MIISVKKIIFAATIVFICIVVLFVTLNIKTKDVFNSTNVKIVLDAGHGSPDGGAVGQSGTLEKDINLSIVQKISEVAEARGMTIILTRTGDGGLQTSDAKTIRQMKVSDMNKRLEIIKNSNADIFLSIHINSFSDSSVSGLHVFYDKVHTEAKELAKIIQEEIGEITGVKTHTVKTVDERLFLMKNPPMMSVLVECGFISNPDEEKLLVSDEYQSKIAWSVVRAIERYVSETAIN